MSEKKRIVVIGGSAAGPKAAARARRLDENAIIIMIERSADLSAASCGYPYYIGGMVEDRKQLMCTPVGVVRDPGFFINAKNITARTRTEALSIDRERKVVLCRDLVTKESYEEPYDKLIIATGSVPLMPFIPGAEIQGIMALNSLEDADHLRRIREEGDVKKAVVVGGGRLGIEMCEALHMSSIDTTVIETLPQILGFLDWQLARLTENNIRDWGVTVVTDNPVVEFLGSNGRLTGVKLQNGVEIPCDLAVITTGVKPDSDIASEAGLRIGISGGILVDDHMATSDPDIYAAGDCIEIRDIITGRDVQTSFGHLANLEGRVAGENAVSGNVASFPGTLRTGVCKVFNYQAGSTGLSERTARELGYEIETVVMSGPDKPGFMGGLPLISKMVVEKGTEKLLGFQCIGPGDVSKQIATAAIALQGELTLEDIVNSDLPDAPPFSLPIDNLVVTAHALENKMRGLFRGISAEEVRRKLDNGERPFILDLRGQNEFDALRLGLGEKLIPLGTLRKRVSELPADKDTEIITYCKTSLRGYEGVRFLQAVGYNNVKVLEGGVSAWPYPREK